MGKKYTITSTGQIKAERDIYSLGGFIPRRSLGGKIASEKQLSQNGECWLANGDISGRPDIRIRDNAYIGNFSSADGIHTNGITEFSGDTKIPGKIIVRNPIADPVNNFVVNNTFIGISMDVVCGPESNTKAFPFGQGNYNTNAPKGTLFEKMVVAPAPTDTCRGIADVRVGTDTMYTCHPGIIAEYFGRILMLQRVNQHTREKRLIPRHLLQNCTTRFIICAGWLLEKQAVLRPPN